MYDSGKIIAGLIIFVGLFTSPFWYDTSNGKALQRPQLVLPSNPNQQVCVADSTFMRCDHMVLLNDWRSQVVRDGKTDYMSNTGKQFEMKYTKTCLGCHPNTAEFCDQCHNYVGVNPYCWDCHNKPELHGQGASAVQILNPKTETLNKFKSLNSQSPDFNSGVF